MPAPRRRLAFVIGIFLEVALEHVDQLVDRHGHVLALARREMVEAVAAPCLVLEIDVLVVAEARSMNSVRSERP